MPSTHTSLQYHIVFSTKNRYPFISKDALTRLHEYLGGCIRNTDATPIRVGGVADHVHMLVGMKPKYAVSDVIRDIKKASTSWMQETFSPKFLWQEGYGAFTVGRRDLAAISLYIDGQEEHHRTRSFEEEYVALLEEEGIAYDPRYLW
jgi:putative transposase